MYAFIPGCVHMLRILLSTPKTPSSVPGGTPAGNKWKPAEMSSPGTTPPLSSGSHYSGSSQYHPCVVSLDTCNAGHSSTPEQQPYCSSGTSNNAPYSHIHVLHSHCMYSITSSIMYISNALDMLSLSCMYPYAVYCIQWVRYS